MANLRRAGVADAAELTRLRALMLTAMGSDPSAPGWASACDAAFARRLAEPERFAAYVVDVDGRAVASGVGWVEEHLVSPGSTDPRRGHIASMSTEPAHRRQGHARAVLSALMSWFVDAGVPRVDLRATPEGRALYESVGFRELGSPSMAWTGSGGWVPVSRP